MKEMKKFHFFNVPMLKGWCFQCKETPKMAVDMSSRINVRCFVIKQNTSSDLPELLHNFLADNSYTNLHSLYVL